MKITHSKLILTHTGSEIPDYTEVCIKQVQKTNPKCEITFIAEEKHCVCNVVHCPNYMVLNEMMYWYLYQLKLGNAALISRYTIDMVHEMTILRHYKNVNYFPSLPDENTLGDYLFDPASYGQYLAGTNNGHDPGFLDTVNHDIGRTFGVKWKGASFKKPYPYIHCMNKTYTKLFNLHMHNKHKIKEFSTI